MSELFTPYKIGPIELRNRTIRSAAFEAMCPGQRPSQELFDYHVSVARGGIGMTTVAYAAVCRSGPPYSSGTAETCRTEASADACLMVPAADSICTPRPSYRR